MHGYLIIDCKACSEKCVVLGEWFFMWLLEVGCRQSREALRELASKLRLEMGWETAR